MGEDIAGAEMAVGGDGWGLSKVREAAEEEARRMVSELQTNCTESDTDSDDDEPLFFSKREHELGPQPSDPGLDERERLTRLFDPSAVEDAFTSACMLSTDNIDSAGTVHTTEIEENNVTRSGIDIGAGIDDGELDGILQRLTRMSETEIDEMYGEGRRRVDGDEGEDDDNNDGPIGEGVGALPSTSTPQAEPLTSTKTKERTSTREYEQWKHERAGVKVARDGVASAPASSTYRSRRPRSLRKQMNAMGVDLVYESCEQDSSDGDDEVMLEIQEYNERRRQCRSGAVTACIVDEL